MTIQSFQECSVYAPTQHGAKPAFRRGSPENFPPHERARTEAQARERFLDGGIYVDVVTGDPEKDYFAVGRMWLTGG